LEELVQETGRVGRDSSEAEAILYYAKGAVSMTSKFKHRHQKPPISNNAGWCSGVVKIS